MDYDDRIEICRNRVFKNDLAFGKNNPIAMGTDYNFVYRVTGINQIYDIIKCGYIRPKEGKVNGGHKNEVFWTQGGEKLFYYDKRPVLEISIFNLKDNEIGAKSINELSALWIFDEESQSYINKLDILIKFRRLFEIGELNISLEEIELLLNGSIPQSKQDKTR